MVFPHSTNPLIPLGLPSLSRCRSMAISISPKICRSEDSGFDHSGDACGKIELWVVGKCRRSRCAKRFASDEVRQECCSTRWQVSDYHLKPRPGNQRILWFGRRDGADRTFTSVCRKYTDRRKSRAHSSRGRMRRQNNIRQLLGRD
jgi:hypothetical protein